MVNVNSRKMIIASLLAVVFVVGIFSTSTFQVSAAGPTFHVLPLKGTVNRTIHVNGMGWNPSATITIKFDSKVILTVMADGTGAFSGTFTLPQAVAGPHTVTASDGTHSVLHTFTVVPHLSDRPKKGMPGITVTLIGTGLRQSLLLK